MQQLEIEFTAPGDQPDETLAPSWAGLAGILAHSIQHGTDEQRQHAISEIHRMAVAADRAIQAREAQQ